MRALILSLLALLLQVAVEASSLACLPPAYEGEQGIQDIRNDAVGVLPADTPRTVRGIGEDTDLP